MVRPSLNVRKGRGAASRIKWHIAITRKNGFARDQKRPRQVINRPARSRGVLSRQRKSVGAENARARVRETGFSPLGASSNFRVPPQGMITGQPRTSHTDFRTELSEIRSSPSAHREIAMLRRIRGIMFDGITRYDKINIYVDSIIIKCLLNAIYFKRRRRPCAAPRNRILDR